MDFKLGNTRKWLPHHTSVKREENATFSSRALENVNFDIINTANRSRTRP